MPQEKIATRIYCCPQCSYRSELRWCLVRHLRLIHKYTKRNAKLVASESEYWLQPNPMYIRRDVYDELNEEDTGED